jgi:two-component system cell cycle response regulator
MAKVLVVDDRETFRTLNAKILELDGHHVTTAGSGRNALTIIRTEHPDIVLLDVMMPGMDGYQVCRQIKQDPETRDIIVVMLTAIPQDTSSRSFQAGADGHISKPISPTEMRDLVRQWSAKKMTRKGQIYDN